MKYVVVLWSMDSNGYEDVLLGTYRTEARAKAYAERYKRGLERTRREMGDDTELVDYYGNFDVLVRPVFPGTLSVENAISAYHGGLEP